MYNFYVSLQGVTEYIEDAEGRGRGQDDLRLDPG